MQKVFSILVLAACSSRAFRRFANDLPPKIDPQIELVFCHNFGEDHGRMSRKRYKAEQIIGILRSTDIVEASPPCDRTGGPIYSETCPHLKRRWADADGWSDGHYGRYGYRRINVLLQREGWQVNHKHVERICLSIGTISDPMIDFVADRTHDGRSIRMLTVVD